MQIKKIIKQQAIKIWPLSVLQRKIFNLNTAMIDLQNKLKIKDNLLNDFEKDLNRNAKELEAKTQIEKDLHEYIIKLERQIKEQDKIEADLNAYSKQLEHQIKEQGKIEADLNIYSKQLEQRIKEQDKIEADLNAYIKQLEQQIEAKNRIEEDLNIYIIQQQEKIQGIEQENLRLIRQLEIQNAKNTDIKSSEYWDNRYRLGTNSGMGSYNTLAEFKAMVVNEFLCETKARTVIELGCGDGNQLSMINYGNYTGVDVSPYIVNINKERFSRDKTKQFFCTLTDRVKYIHNKYDVSISMDVIFHLLEEDAFKSYMDDLFSLSDKCVVIYSSNHEEYTKWPEYRHRKFMAYFQEHVCGWELEKFIPNKYPYIIGRENETSTSDFYIFKKQLRGE